MAALALGPNQCLPTPFKLWTVHCSSPVTLFVPELVESQAFCVPPAIHPLFLPLSASLGGRELVLILWALVSGLSLLAGLLQVTGLCLGSHVVCGCGCLSL